MHTHHSIENTEFEWSCWNVMCKKQFISHYYWILTISTVNESKNHVKISTLHFALGSDRVFPPTKVTRFTRQIGDSFFSPQFFWRRLVHCMNTSRAIESSNLNYCHPKIHDHTHTHTHKRIRTEWRKKTAIDRSWTFFFFSRANYCCCGCLSHSDDEFDDN